MELLGSTLFNLSQSSENYSFSSVTVMKIGFQVVSAAIKANLISQLQSIYFQLDVLEHIHSRFILHFDIGNLAIGYKNNSKIYAFGELKLTIHLNIYICFCITLFVFFFILSFSPVFGFSIMSELGVDHRRHEDLKELAELLICFAQGTFLNDDDDV